jgi:osmotically-inducible protein OsmY
MTLSTMTDARTDEQIQKDVFVELKWDARVLPNEIGVAVKNGIVTLTGWVDSYVKRWAAEEAAHRVWGVVAVVNDLELRLPSSSERADPDIAAAAVNALKWDAFVPIDQIKVTVSKGWITLEGEVDWQYQKVDAERVVGRLAGVKGVTNFITVRPSVTPQGVKKMIEEALVRSVKTDAGRITVQVEGSKVTLKGTVRSWTERDEAERAAWQAPGITEVSNQIVIAP